MNDRTNFSIMSSTLKSRYRPRFEARKHSNLCTVQRRLRHLTSIIGRNIDPNLVPSRRQSPKSILLSLYFTIHAADDPSIILYKSETIENTLNPNWREFDSNVFSSHPSYLKASSVIVCIWGARKTSSFIPIFRYNVAFSGLAYSKEQLRSHDQVYEANSLLFGMFGGFYMAPPNTSQVDSDDVVLCSMIKVEGSQVHLSYKKASLLRVYNSIKAIYETRQQVAEVQNKMEHVLSQNEHRKQKCMQREFLMFRNKLLRVEWKKLTEKLLGGSQNAQREREDIMHRKEELHRRRQDLEQSISELEICHSAYIRRREMLLRVTANLNFRRRQLAAELSYIYPIIQLPIKEDNKREYAISGVNLPNSEDFLGKNETMLAVALGNVSHLIQMMAKFMELPLRYPIRFMGSRSSVVDLVTDKFTDKQREFPLYLKGKDKFEFHYGVFLLNKNIAQLRYHNGLGTPDLRSTLINLKHLLEVKYGVRIVVINQSTIGFNKADLMAGRSISLPNTSSPTDPHLSSLNFDVADGTANEFIQKEHRSQSDYMSGLPTVHVKSHNQHRFLARNSNGRKNKHDSLIEIEEVVSSDLIEVPFEDVVRRTISGDFPHNKVPSNLGSRDSLNDINKIDCGEDCLNGNLCSDNYGSSRIDNTEDNSDRGDNYTHQLSDALIIPHQYEMEHDATVSPSETIMV